MPAKKTKKTKKAEPIRAIKMVVHNRVLPNGLHQYAFSGVLVSDVPLTNIDIKEDGDVVLEGANTLEEVDVLQGALSILQSRKSKRPGLSLGQAVMSLPDL